MKRIAVWGLALLGLSALAIVGATREQRASVAEAAVTRTPTQVEVTNFPATQDVAGAVNVANLPLDAEGNVRVSDARGASGPAAQLVGVRFHETDRNFAGRFPLIPLPTGYRTISLFVQTTDATVAGVNNWSVGFGSNTAPLVHYNIGDFQVFATSAPLNSQFNYVPGDFAGLFNITGTHLQLLVNASGPAGGKPVDSTEYYVSLYLMP
jgi:hypothetical protein